MGSIERPIKLGLFQLFLLNGANSRSESPLPPVRLWTRQGLTIIFTHLNFSLFQKNLAHEEIETDQPPQDKRFEDP